MVNECSHVLRRKAGWRPSQIAAELTLLIGVARLVDVRMSEVRAALAVAECYGFSHFDSHIVATALAADCTTLYTEDLQHGQVIDGRLTLVNPFLAAGAP